MLSEDDADLFPGPWVPVNLVIILHTSLMRLSVCLREPGLELVCQVSFVLWHTTLYPWFIYDDPPVGCI